MLYVKPTAGHDTHGQSAIIDEDSGETIAIVYDGKKWADRLAAAPDLLAELKWAENTLRWAAQESAGRVKAEIVGGWLHHADRARAAIAKATKNEGS